MLFTNRFRIFVIITITLGLTLLGCDQSVEPEETQDMHICEHLTYGPETSLTASADYQSAINKLNSDSTYLVQYQLHTRYDIALLVDNTGHYYGHTPYRPVADDGDYILYMDQAVDVTIRNVEDGSVVTAEETYDHSDDCAAVAYKGYYHFHAEDTYILSFEDLHESKIGMLFPEAEDEGHDH